MEYAETVIVGAGVFGSSAAISLAEAGQSCILIDGLCDILHGATANNQNRLHTGLHYPRDLNTAIQSASGRDRFLQDYPLAVNGEFSNYYFIAKLGSRTSVDSFESFARSIDTKLDSISNDELVETGIDPSLISAGWKVDERVIDIPILRNLMRARLFNASVSLQMDTHIDRLSFLTESEKWRIYAKNGQVFESRNIVLGTYGFPISGANGEIEWEPRLYQVTVVPIVKTSKPSLGVTVMDGDFVTLLPRGFSDETLLYGPSTSVAYSTYSLEEALQFQATQEASLKLSHRETIDRSRIFFPTLSILDSDESLMAIRSLPIDSSQTDQRRSYVKPLGNNAYQLVAGKVDHATQIADHLTRLILLER